jgi:hypothetical protein
MAKTVVGLFSDFDTAEQVVRELENQGFARDAISLISRDQTRYGRTEAETRDRGTHAGEGAAAGAGTGAVVGGIAGLLVGLGVLAIPGIGPLLAAGPIATTLAGIGVGGAAGGIIGALTGAGVPKEEAHAYAEGVRRGGTLVMVQTPDNMANRARDIMNRFNPIDIRHESQGWQQSENWRGFDESSQPYSDADMSRQRESWRSSAYSGSGAGLGTGYQQGTMSGTGMTSETGTGLGYGESTTSGTSSGTGYDRGTSSGMGYEEGTTTGPQRGYTADFRNDYNSYYGSRGRDYSYYEPGYRYGYDLAHNPAYQGRTWSDIESQVRQDWERTHPNNAWGDFKDSIRRAWERVTAG